MKRILFVLTALAVRTLSAVYLFSFDGSELGEDYYADGSPLLQGECYAVVWQRNGTEFKGFYRDGSPVDPENCEIFGILSGEVGAQHFQDEEGTIYAYCPLIIGEVHNDDPRRTTGYFSVYAFDTRVLGSDGQLRVGGLDAAGHLVALNSYSVVDSLEKLTLTPKLNPDYEPDPQLADLNGPTSTETEAIMPLYVPEPVVSAFAVTNGVVTLSVTNTASYLRYNVTGAGELGELLSTTNLVGTAKQGGGVLTWTIPAPGAKGFYKVIRQPLVEPGR